MHAQSLLNYAPIVAISRLAHRVAGRLGLGVLLALTALTAQAAGPIRVVALGDSLTAGYGVLANEALPARLETALKARGLDVVIDNAGVSGDTAAGGLARLDWSVPDGTEAVLLALGANDMLRGSDPAEMKAALDEILTRLEKRGIKVMLLGMLAAPNLGPDYRQRYDAVFADLAGKHAVPWVPFLLQDVAGVQALNQPDGMHPNARGVEVMVARLAGPVETFLKGLRGS
jgi:acyl-CoA thioesterase I